MDDAAEVIRVVQETGGRLLCGENRARITEAAELGYEDVELTLEDFLAAIPDAPPGPRMYGRPRRVIVPPPPSD